MEAQLKALKVPDLKDILARASTPAPAKANKADLIAKILATPAAVDVYNKQNGVADDDLLEEPQDLDALGADPVPASTAAPAAPVPASAAPASATAPTAATDAPATVDPELEKRKARAARFGIPFVEHPVPRTGRGPRGKAAGVGAANGKVAPATAVKKVDEQSKAEPAANARPGRAKRAAPDEADPEEQERRRKRAERFGTGAAAPAATKA